ncbi:MAG: putative metalloprotease CJM1_0395 family protein, partial [Pseudomonadota bacterium]
GGAVAIYVSPVDGDPDATIDKMEVVKAAALAPAEPSSADRQVAALADAQRAQAVADLAVLRAAERDGTLDQRV